MKEQLSKEFFCKNGKLKNKFESLTRISAIKTYDGHTIVHGKYWSGWTKIIETQYDRFYEACRLMEIKKEYGNDAPRGGVMGDYIKVKTEDYEKLISLLKEAMGE